jgi:hypothetical protein
MGLERSIWEIPVKEQIHWNEPSGDVLAPMICRSRQLWTKACSYEFRMWEDEWMLQKKLLQLPISNSVVDCIYGGCRARDGRMQEC